MASSSNDSTCEKRPCVANANVYSHVKPNADAKFETPTIVFSAAATRSIWRAAAQVQEAQPTWLAICGVVAIQQTQATLDQIERTIVLCKLRLSSEQVRDDHALEDCAHVTFGSSNLSVLLVVHVNFDILVTGLESLKDRHKRRLTLDDAAGNAPGSLVIPFSRTRSASCTLPSREHIAKMTRMAENLG
jgi:hypothetical protein